MGCWGGPDGSSSSHVIIFPMFIQRSMSLPFRVGGVAGVPMVLHHHMSYSSPCSFKDPCQYMSYSSPCSFKDPCHYHVGWGGLLFWGGAGGSPGSACELPRPHDDFDADDDDDDDD